MKREAEYKSSLMRELRATLKCVALRHEDRFTSGIPDISVTMGGRTSWWEAKHAQPSITSEGIQELTMLRLAACGYARYIIWEERRGSKRTLIVHPKRLKTMEPDVFIVGFDMRWLVDQIRLAHGA
jgi:hypothetical protein